MAKGDRTNLGPCDCCGPPVTCCSCGNCCFSDQSVIDIDASYRNRIWSEEGCSGEVVIEWLNYRVAAQGLTYADCGFWFAPAPGIVYYGDGTSEPAIIAVEAICTTPVLWSFGFSLDMNASQREDFNWADALRDTGGTHAGDCCGWTGPTEYCENEFDETSEQWTGSFTVLTNHCCKDAEGNCQPGTPDPACDETTGDSGGCDDAP